MCQTPFWTYALAFAQAETRRTGLRHTVQKLAPYVDRTGIVRRPLWVVLPLPSRYRPRHRRR